MSAKAIREAEGKALLARYLGVLKSENGVGKNLQFPVKTATVKPDTDFTRIPKEHPWLETEVMYKVQQKTVFHDIVLIVCF